MSGRIILCGDQRPGPRDECPNRVHDWPLPSGYVDHAGAAMSRLSRRWTNRKCPTCGLYGWEPGRMGPNDVKTEPTPTHDGTDLTHDGTDEREGAA